jgi:hypothetical protein
MPYKNINHTLKALKGKSWTDLPYALNECPQFDSPQQVFNYFKQRITYKNYPKV